MEKTEAVLLDIEGTTTSISFVKDKLFPYARQHVSHFLSNHIDEEGCQEAVRLIMGKDVPNLRTRRAKYSFLADVTSEVNHLMDMDEKSTGLKSLQGMIWETAYRNGDIKGHIFKDVLPALQRWTDQGKRLFIYSSGSVFAQKLLFGYSEKGDLLQLFEGHFDTKIGLKLVAESYEAIAREIGVPPGSILFFTDNPKEAIAAKAAGIRCMLVDRPGNAALDRQVCSEFPVVTTFNGL